METVVMVALAVIVVAIVGYLVARDSRRRPDEKALVVHRRVLVNLKSGDAIAGVILEELPKRYVIADPALVEPGSGPVPIDGDVVVDKIEVAFIQRYADKG